MAKRPCAPRDRDPARRGEQPATSKRRVEWRKRALLAQWIDISREWDGLTQPSGPGADVDRVSPPAGHRGRARRTWT